MALPYHIAHHSRSTPKQGHARNAKGLILPCVVIDVYRPGDPAGDKGRSADMKALGGGSPGVTCTVLAIPAGYRTLLYNVPISTMSAGLNDYVEWIPRPTKVDIRTGAPAKYTKVSAVDPRPITPTHFMDGDHVLVGFLQNDMSQPVILGQIPHPNNNRRPQFTDVAKYKYRRHVRGIDIGVTDGGNVEINMASASSGAIVPTLGTEVPTAPIAGNLTMTLAPLAKVSILDSFASDPNHVIMGETFLEDLNNALIEISGQFAAMGSPLPLAPVGSVANMILFINTSLIAQLPYLSTHLETD